VYCLACSHDGTRFASGGADKSVIIWGANGQGLLKFTHSSTIQALAYNPVTQQLASASQKDFGLWSPEVRSVPKIATPSRVLCAAWSHDGQYLALGCEDGSVAIKDKAGGPHASFQRGAAVWSLAFSPCATPDQPNVLAVTSWDSTLSLHKVFCPSTNSSAVPASTVRPFCLHGLESRLFKQFPVTSSLAKRATQ
jgi:intraflagellar transport protein 122